MVFNDGKINEELLETRPLHGKIWSIDTDLTAEQNELSTELQGENKTVTQMIGTADSFKGKLK
jgi:hypothetical protein